LGRPGGKTFIFTMTKVVIYTVNVEFGDCDPAAIVWFPNFFRWIDAASRHFFMQCGVPRWEETAQTLGVIGTPLVDTKSRFIKTASYGDVLDIAVTITEWRNKSFVQTYRITRANASGEPDLIMECEEVRIFAAKREVVGESGKPGIRAVPAPDAIRRLCE
jgi:4-hydroxybenzoyl-CoA thioesterase